MVTAKKTAPAKTAPAAKGAARPAPTVTMKPPAAPALGPGAGNALAAFTKGQAAHGSRLDAHDGRLDGHDASLAAHDDRLAALEKASAGDQPKDSSDGS